MTEPTPTTSTRSTRIEMREPRSLEFAAGADIIRSNQKDQYYSSVLIDQIRSILRTSVGSRVVNARSDEIRTLGNLIYLSLTTLINERTLGEEYCDIVYTESTGRSLPSAARRATFVASSSLLPYILAKSWPILRHRLAFISPKSPKLREIADIMSTYMTFRNLETIHLALFYFTGAYYTLARRTAGMRYIFTRKMEESSERIGYEIPGFLMIARLTIPLLSSMLARETDDGTTSRKGNTIKYDLSDESLMPFLVEDARKCTLCLSLMLDPTATSCGHLFCWTCISEWTRTKPECPLCRQSVSPSHLLPLQG